MDRPPQLRLFLEPSWIAQCWCVAVSFVALSAIALAGIGLWLKAGLMALVAWLSVRAVRAQRQPRWRAVCRDGDGWQLLDRHGCTFTVQRQSGGYCGFGLVVIPFLLPCGKPVEVLVWPDSAGREARRRLRIAWQEPY